MSVDEIQVQVEHVDAAGGVSARDVGFSPRGKLGSRRPWVVYIAAFWLILVLVCALCATWLPLADPNANVSKTRIAPFHEWPEIFGTDRFGRSVLARLIFGARVSLAVGVISAGVGMSIGFLLGMLLGMIRIAEAVIGTLTDTVLAVPGIVLLIALRASLGPGFGTSVFDPGVATLVLGLTILSMPPFIRVSGASTKQVTRREYVEAAKLLGARRRRILLREVVPSVLRPMVAYGIVVLSALMVTEASASFLNLGVQLPTASWGGMIRDGQKELDDHPELVFIPGVVLFTTVLSVAAIGRALLRKANPGESRL